MTCDGLCSSKIISITHATYNSNHSDKCETERQIFNVIQSEIDLVTKIARVSRARCEPERSVPSFKYNYINDGVFTTDLPGHPQVKPNMIGENRFGAPRSQVSDMYSLLTTVAALFSQTTGSLETILRDLPLIAELHQAIFFISAKKILDTRSRC